MKTRKTKLLIVIPDGKIHGIHVGNFSRSFREAPVTATLLAALVPENLNIEVQIVDESVSKIDFKVKRDIVALSLLTGTAPRAFEIAKEFKKKHQSTIIMGGVHVGLRPEEVAQHADCIVIGYAEKTWPKLLNDYINNTLEKKYIQSPVESKILDGLPIPKRDLLKRWRYNVPDSTFATRGCRFSCDFCTTAAIDPTWQIRPVGEVIKDVKTMNSRIIAFNDVNIINDREYALELFKAMEPLNQIWGGLGTIHIANDPELLEALYKSGCRYLLIGLESVNKSSLLDIQKGFNTIDKYKHLVDTLHSYKISIQGCFIFGMESDDLNIFMDTVDLVNELKIDIPRYAIYTPYPGTPAYNRLNNEGRILHNKWEYYDTQHVVFKPNNMSPIELDEGFKRAFKETFKWKHNVPRSIQKGGFSIINFMGNMAYKLFIRKLINDKDRFPAYDKLSDVSKGDFLLNEYEELIS